MKFSLALICAVITLNLCGQSTILWEVHHPNSKSTSYLLGTFHQFGNSFVDSIPEIGAALKNSNLIVFESIDATQAQIDAMNQRECTTEAEELLGRKSYSRLKKLSKDWSVELCKLSTTEIYLKLRQELPRKKCLSTKPTDTWDHFDDYLLHQAKENGKRIKGLETDTFQLEAINEAFAASSKKEDKKRLKALIAVLSSDGTKGFDCSFVNDYRNYKLDYAFDTPCEEGVMIEGRNAKWMKSLPTDLKLQNCLVVVGLKHLMFQCGLIEQLKAQGFEVTPVPLN